MYATEMSESRQRLRPWLESKLNAGCLPGLVWLPNEKGLIDKLKFKIPWKHGGKHDWTPDQGRVWKEWAIHTGKYRPGVDEEAYAKWKTNLRCALNKASDIQEITEESQREADEPFKVYRFLPRKDKKHPVHKREYTTEDGLGLPSDLPGMTHLPAQVADYSSSLSSRGSSIRSIRSNPFSLNSGASRHGDGMDMGSIPSDLVGLNSGSLREMGHLASAEREQYIKDECMDCDDDTSRNTPQWMEMPSSAFTAPGRPIKQESADLFPSSAASLSNAPPPPSNGHDFLKPGRSAGGGGVPFCDQLLDMAAGPLHPHDYMNGGSHVMNGGSHGMNGASHGMNGNNHVTAENAHLTPGYGRHVAPPPSVSSSQFSPCSAPSPQSMYSPGGYTRGQPSPGGYTTQPSSCATSHYSPAASPQFYHGGVGSTSPAPSPLHAPSSCSQPSPRPGGTYPPSTSTTGLDALSPMSAGTAFAPPSVESCASEVCGGAGGGGLDYGAGVVGQFAELGVRDRPEGANTHALHPNMRLLSEVDIGHECHESPEECSMMVRVLYKNKVITECHVTGPDGCMFAYNPITQRDSQILDDAGLQVVKEAVYDHKSGRLQVALPDWRESGNVKLDREVDNLLRNTGRGISLECKRGDIYAKRLCKTSVYYATHFENACCRKINRTEESHDQVKIFDFHNVFEPALLYFEQEVRTNSRAEAKHPNPDVYLFVGQNGTPSNAHTRYVVIRVTSCKASKLLKMKERQLYSLSAEVSKSDSLDQIDENIRQGLATS